MALCKCSDIGASLEPNASVYTWQELLGNRARFIAMIIAKKLHVNNRKKAGKSNQLTMLKANQKSWYATTYCTIECCKSAWHSTTVEMKREVWRCVKPSFIFFSKLVRLWVGLSRLGMEKLFTIDTWAANESKAHAPSSFGLQSLKSLNSFLSSCHQQAKFQKWLA